MKKIIRLTESDLERIVKRTILEMNPNDAFNKYAEGPFSIGNADYEKDIELHRQQMDKEKEMRKYSIPAYNETDGRWNNWTRKTLKDYVYRHFGVELPDDLRMSPSKVSQWLRDNGYERK